MGLIVDIRKKLSGFSLDTSFEAGSDATGLLGASGSGKSMTLKCIAGLEKPDSGKIILNGRILFDSEKGIHLLSRHRKVGYLFQNYALFPNMTVEQNIGFALGNISAEKRKAVVYEKIVMMKLQGLEKRYPHQLSGGQQQRVALARALAVEPEVLLLDEPFSALDEHLRGLMVKQLVELLSAYQGVTLFVTHNMEEAYCLCKQLIILNNGSVESAGHKDQLFQHPPSLTTAQLTGCKNFSRVKVLSGNHINAVDWGMNLTVHQKSRKDRTLHTGIHAHYLRLATETDNENVFDCRPSFISETPFRVTVFLSVGKLASNSEDFHLQWNISKEKWLALKNQELPWRLYMDPEKLMIFEK